MHGGRDLPQRRYMPGGGGGRRGPTTVPLSGGVRRPAVRNGRRRLQGSGLRERRKVHRWAEPLPLPMSPRVLRPPVQTTRRRLSPPTVFQRRALRGARLPRTLLPMPLPVRIPRPAMRGPDGPLRRRLVRKRRYLRRRRGNVRMPLPHRIQRQSLREGDGDRMLSEPMQKGRAVRPVVRSVQLPMSKRHLREYVPAEQRCVSVQSLSERRDMSGDRGGVGDRETLLLSL